MKQYGSMWFTFLLLSGLSTTEWRTAGAIMAHMPSNVTRQRVVGELSAGVRTGLVQERVVVYRRRESVQYRLHPQLIDLQSQARWLAGKDS